MLSLLSGVATWWKGANSSNILSVILGITMLFVYINGKQEAAQQEDKANEAVRVIAENNEASIAALHRTVEDKDKYIEYQRNLKESEHAEYLNTPIPESLP